MSYSTLLSIFFMLVRRADLERGLFLLELYTWYLHLPHKDVERIE